MTPFQFIIGALATYRLTVLVSRDLGPWDCFKRLRSLSPRWLGCPYCFSVTAAAGIEAAFYFCGIRDSVVVAVAIVFAMSAISIILDRCFTADHSPQ